MDKIIIIGSSGAGKSTLARKLSHTLHIKVFHLDRLFWSHSWKRKISYERIKLLEHLTLTNKQWIIEGNYLKSLEFSLMKADMIIFLDIPSLLCLYRIIKRHFASYEPTRHDIPEECTDKLTLRCLWKTLTFPFHGRKMIEHTLCNYGSKRIIRLHSSKEVQAFLEWLKQVADEKDHFSTNPLKREVPLTIRR
jgi:adenylate kinase family enzyme